MLNAFTRYFGTHYHRIVNSIAFYPACIAIAFLVLSYGMIVFDFSDTGTSLKANWKWLRLQDASTARSISSSITAGIISLTVFTFTMVMIVLNQAASNMTNRVLDGLIGNRFQQIVLGIYIGTIVYALFLLSTIRDIDSGVYIASLSTYLLILITVLDIFLFIYFLHYVTNSIKVHVIVKRIYKQTRKSLEASCPTTTPQKVVSVDAKSVVTASRGGVFENIRRRGLLRLCKELDCVVEILVPPGQFVIRGSPLLTVNKTITEEMALQFEEELLILDAEEIEENYFYGLQQLTEIALKALSPGINDPGSAIISMRSLFLLFQYRARRFDRRVVCDERDEPRIIVPQLSFEHVFRESILPIWDYGKNDRLFRRELLSLLMQLEKTTSSQCVRVLLEEVKRYQQSVEFSS